jgi:hypothetical protein
MAAFFVFVESNQYEFQYIIGYNNGGDFFHGLRGRMFMSFWYILQAFRDIITCKYHAKLNKIGAFEKINLCVTASLQVIQDNFLIFFHYFELI